MITKKHLEIASLVLRALALVLFVVLLVVR